MQVGVSGLGFAFFLVSGIVFDAEECFIDEIALYCEHLSADIRQFEFTQRRIRLRRHAHHVLQHLREDLRMGVHAMLAFCVLFQQLLVLVAKLSYDVVVVQQFGPGDSWFRNESRETVVLADNVP